jgi:hypothetical protein
MERSCIDEDNENQMLKKHPKSQWPKSILVTIQCRPVSSIGTGCNIVPLIRKKSRQPASGTVRTSMDVHCASGLHDFSQLAFQICVYHFILLKKKSDFAFYVLEVFVFILMGLYKVIT